MKFSVTISVCLLFAAVSGYYFLLEPKIHRKQAALPSAEKSVSEHILALATGERVVTVEIRREKNEIIVFELKKDRWMLTRPVDSRANSELIRGLVSALTLSLRSRRLEREKGWEEYGLAAPKMKIGVRTDQSEKMRLLDFGGLSPVGDFIYARWEDEQEYFLADPAIQKIFETSLYSFREKQLFFIPQNQMTKIRVQTFEKNYELVREQGEWYWSEPIELLAEEFDKQKLAEVLTRLAGLYAKEFLDQEKRADDRLGISEVGAGIQIWGEGAEPQSLWIGHEVATKDGFFARSSEEKAPLLIARSNLREFFEIFEIAARRNAAVQPK